MANQPGPTDQSAPSGGGEVRSDPSRAADATGHLAGAAEQEARETRRQASETAEEVTQEARKAAEQAKDQAYSTADRQKDAAAQQMGGWAHALRTASDDLRDRGQDSVAAYVQRAADGLERASGTVRERNIDDLVGTVEDFARRQPVAFLGGAVATGFGLARFMRSSADRRRNAAAAARTGEGGTA